ncbi:MAG: UDP-2,3-diacylglucosamine diphosphatase LpxI [Methylobacterium sp.]|uniref:LpxI family protein n=1 Tax=Methylobacterium sp. TaxID=409 RepID=UPI002719C290|nr:UDP-2,3-diacylglucosamine diphosphatase LpxI [Methylobacterium sp.]MDO9427998.1 UDP-2,3-diacylglucosamine diphosphatase LpxI [Methylobacterium sp.]
MRAQPAPLVLVAGAGRLPELVAESLDRAGRPFRILAIRGFAERTMRARAEACVDLLDIAGVLAILKAWGPVSVVPAGGVARPNPAAILNAAAALRNRDALKAIAGGGDDRLLRGALALLEENGHAVVGVHEVAPDLLSPEGVMGRHAPDAAALASIATGRTLLSALAPYDVGQAAVVAAQRALTVEGPEGTDRMLARARALGRKPFGFGASQPGTVLVKVAKTGQDLRVDLPAVGPRTVAAAAAAGCAGLAIQAGFTLIIDRPATVAAADRAGLFLIGLRIDA